jgi:peptidoglycan hydrolase CwlO-like protein
MKKKRQMPDFRFQLISIVFVLTSSVWLLSSFAPMARAVECSSNLPSSQEDWVHYISDCQSKLRELAGQKQTLASAIDYLSTQIKLTQAKIAATTIQLATLNQEITDLSGKIGSINYSLNDLTKFFVARVRDTYMYRGSPESLFISQTSGLTDIIRSIEYTKKVRDYDRTVLIALEKSRLDYNAQKDIKETKQKAVAALQAKLTLDKSALADQVTSKNKLLADTQNSETRYQQLLSSARAQLAAFSRFVNSQGGASILNNTTSSDSWGTYYNQRDSQWGNKFLGLSDSTMAQVGCLVTSMSMVATHYGKSLSPGDIAGSTIPFWGNTAYMNKGSWAVNGVTMNRTSLPVSQASIDSELSAGRPVIVGIYGGPDHFLVIRAKNGDNDYLTNDPFPENGFNSSFLSHYPSLGIITSVDRVSVN